MSLLHKDVFDLFNNWCILSKTNCNVSSNKFGIDLKRLNISGVSKGKHTNKGDLKDFNIPLLKSYFNINDLPDLPSELLNTCL